MNHPSAPKKKKEEKISFMISGWAVPNCSPVLINAEAGLQLENRTGKWEEDKDLVRL